MLKYLRQHGEQGQTAVLLALAMIGLLGIVGLALDGGMLYWNQRRAQNGADAAAVAGVTKLVENVMNKTCTGKEQEILLLVHEYAGVNEVPNADVGENVLAFYLIEDASGNRIPLIYPGTGQPWQVGETGSIPCDQDPVGLQVKASFPQQTFLAGIIGIANTNVTVDASAVFTTFTACDSFVLLALDDNPNQNTLNLSGSGIRVYGAGVHSNGGIHIRGGGQSLWVDPEQPIEYGEDGDPNIDPSMLNPERIGTAKPVGGSDFYQYDDFAPEAGTIYLEVRKNDPSMIHIVSGDLDEGKVTDASGKYIDGLYIVPDGDVKLGNVAQRDPGDPPWRVTIVTHGTIQFSGGGNVLPYARGVLLFTDNDNTSDGAVKMSGNENRWGGLIIAPNGLVSTSGASNSDLSGMIVAASVDFSGSGNTVQHHPTYCPPEPPKVLLIQ